MKELTKKILCLLVALALVFTLCACGNDKDDDDDDDEKEDKKPSTSETGDADEEEEDTLESLEGDWEVTFDVEQLMAITGVASDEDDVMTDMYESVDAELTLIFSFTEDEASLFVEENDLERFVEDFTMGAIDWLADGGFYKLYGEIYQMDEDEIDEMLAEQGTTMQEEVNEMAAEMQEEASVEGLFGDMELNDDGMYVISDADDYTFDGTVLELDGEELELSYKKGTITVESASGNASFMEGLKMKKK